MYLYLNRSVTTSRALGDIGCLILGYVCIFLHHLICNLLYGLHLHVLPASCIMSRLWGFPSFQFIVAWVSSPRLCALGKTFFSCASSPCHCQDRVYVWIWLAGIAGGTHTEASSILHMLKVHSLRLSPSPPFTSLYALRGSCLPPLLGACWLLWFSCF